MLSHGHHDHTGGLEYLLNTFKTHAIWDNDRLLHKTGILGKVGHLGLHRGDTVRGKGYTITALHPYEGFYCSGRNESEENSEENNDSLILRIQGETASFLFTGDVEREEEEDAAHTGSALKSTVLKVAHHGSRTSSSEEFINAVSPEIAVISIGRHNRFGHPNEETLARLVNCRVLRTDRDGAIGIRERDRGKVEVKTWKDIQITAAKGIGDEWATSRSCSECGRVSKNLFFIYNSGEKGAANLFQEVNASVGNVLVDALKAGMVLKSDATDAAGRLLIRGGAVISEANIRMFKNRAVEYVDIEGIEEKVAEAGAAVQPEADVVSQPETEAINVPPTATGAAAVSPPAAAAGAATDFEISKEDENKIKIMQATPFFRPFTERELSIILKNGRWLKCNAGDIILREGAVASDRSFFVILKGSICIKKRVGGTTMKKTLQCLKKGECFGEMAVITGKPRSADAVAEEEAFVLKIDADTLNKDTDSFDLRSIQLKFYKTFCEIMAQRLAQTAAMAVNPF